MALVYILAFLPSLSAIEGTSAKTANLFGNPICLLARWRERMEVRVVEISFHSPHPRPRPKGARELLFPNRCLEAALGVLQLCIDG